MTKPARRLQRIQGVNVVHSPLWNNWGIIGSDQANYLNFYEKKYKTKRISSLAGLFWAKNQPSKQLISRGWAYVYAFLADSLTRLGMEPVILEKSEGGNEILRFKMFQNRFRGGVVRYNVCVF